MQLFFKNIEIQFTDINFYFDLKIEMNRGLRKSFIKEK